MNIESRPRIPAEIKRRVLVEAGHRCALPTCRHITVEIHHIVPWETCKAHEYQNLIALCPNCHVRAGLGEIDRKSLRIYKASLRFTHDKFSQFEVDVLLEAAKLPSNRGLPYPRGMELLVKRLLESGFVTFWENPEGSVAMFGMRVDPLLLIVTGEGKEYVRSLGLETSDWSEADV